MSAFWNFTKTMVSGSLAKAEDVNVNFTGIDAGYALVEADITAIELITDFITVTQAVNLDTVETDIAASKVITDFISVSQSVDLDTMESDTVANNSKVSNATHTGEVTGSGALTIAANAVTLSKMADMATASFLGRLTAATGDPEVLTAAQARSILNVESGAAADQTNAEIRAAIEAATNSNAFTDALKALLDAVGANSIMHSGAIQTKSGGLTLGDDLWLSNSDPRIRMIDTSSSVDNKEWDVVNQNESFYVRAYTDDRTGVTHAVTITRTGIVIDQISLNATLVALSGDLAVVGTVDGRNVATDGTKLDSLGAQNVKLNTKVFDIGDWDMDATGTIEITHGLTASKIRSVSALIRNNADTLYYDFAATRSVPIETSANSLYAASTFINLSRATDGLFDNTNYNSTSFNRGWVTIQYID